MLFKTFKIKECLMATMLFIALIANQSCRSDIELVISEEIEVDVPTEIVGHKGLYLLNEGNMGNNKATLDYLDFKSGKYIRNIYAERNPEVPKEMGDVGNDLAVYGSRMYAVINASNKVEVMDAETTRRIGQVDIPNCRFIKFHDKYAYVTSYAGPIIIDPNYQQKGFVAKVDTATLEVVDHCIVGFQPDELEIVDGKIYVANSGGYMGVGNDGGYERTVSVIDIDTFEEERRIDVAINLEMIRADKRGNLWVTSRGNHYDDPSKIFFIDTEKGEVTDTISVPVNSMWMDGDSLYVMSNNTSGWDTGYYIIDTKSRNIIVENFITDGTDKEIELPYGLMVHPETKDIYITDAGNFITPGVLYCFNKYGKKKWDVRTGDIPAHFALLPIYGNK